MKIFDFDDNDDLPYRKRTSDTIITIVFIAFAAFVGYFVFGGFR